MTEPSAKSAGLSTLRESRLKTAGGQEASTPFQTEQILAGLTFITGRARFRLVVNFVHRKSLWAICLLLATSACGNSLYKVKPVVELPPLPATARATNLGGLTLRAAPLVLDEESQELFEANLPLSGLLPVRVEMIHNSGETIELKRVHFRLHDGEGNEWKTVSAKQAIGLILKANDVYAYNPQSRKTFEKEFRAYEFDLKSPLTHAERQRSGFIIFQSPKKSPVASPHGLVLSIEGLSQPASLTLN